MRLGLKINNSILKNRKKDTKRVKKECDELLKNAFSSFEHGVEHLVDGVNEKNIKFSILHIFNAIELIIKYYLLDENEVLILTNIDDKNYLKNDNIKDDDQSTADIRTLLLRMNRFSDYVFTDDFLENIEKLRKKRNLIEHKKFVIEDEKDILKILFFIVEGFVDFVFLLESSAPFEDIGFSERWVNNLGSRLADYL